MTALTIAEKQIRQARWLIERAAPAVVNLPVCAAALDEARVTLGQIAGDYREGEEQTFARFAVVYESVPS